jgi:signal transduction histidine kinase
MFGFNKKKTVVNKSNITKLFTEEEVRIIGKLGVEISSTIDFDMLLQKSADAVVDVLKLHGCILFLKDQTETNIYTKTISQSKQSRVAQQMLNLSNFKDKLSVSLNTKENLVVDSIINNRINESTELWRYTIGVIDRRFTEIIQTATFTGNCISIPVIYQEKTIGALLFTKRQKEDSYDREKVLLESYASQVGIAITNSGLFEAQYRQLEVIKAKNSDLQSLYNLSSKVSESLDPNLVAQTAVNSLPQDKFIIGSIISTHDESTDTLGPIAVTQNELAHQAQNIVGDFTKLRVGINDEAGKLNLAVRAFIEEKKIYTNDIGKYMEPVVFSNVISKVLQLINIKSIAIHPITWKNETHGVITYFIKDKNSEEVSDSEKQLLDTYTSHITIALENAELYKMQKQIQEELEKAYKQVQSLRQHEQDMIDIMGHELRTPITIVRNSLGVMEMEFNKNGTIPPEKLSRYIDIAMESARREVRLVETLLSSAKADSKGFQLIFEKVDITDAIQDSLELFTKEGAKKGIEVLFKAKDEHFIYGDRVRTQEIIDNLLSNAVKYTDKGKVEVNLKNEKDHVLIEVSDSGIGMSEENIKRLGKKFYRVDQYIKKPDEKPEETKDVIRPGGTGLGLYVAFSLIKIMDGTYEVQSEIGKGSKFIVRLPIYNGQPNKQEQRKVEEV